MLAVVGEDYQPASGTLTFFDGEISRTIEVALLDDMAYEGDESFVIALSNVQGGATIGLLEEALITINEDDSKPVNHNTTDSNASTTGSSAFDPLYLLFLMTYLVFFYVKKVKTYIIVSM